MGKYIATVTDHLVLPALARLPEGEELVRERTGRSVTSPVPVRLLIDTGSKRTTLIPGILSHLDPQSDVAVRVTTSLATGMTRLFWVRFDFPQTGLAPFDPVRVADLTMPADLSQFYGVLGRDLLRRLESFDYEGRRSRYTPRDTPGLLGWLRARL